MMCNMFGGEILNEFEIGDFERSPHTYSCTYLYSKKTKVETRRDSTGFNTGESKFYSVKEWEVFLKHLIIFLILLILSIFIFI